MVRVIEVNDLERLHKFHLAWSLLLPQTRGASFFQSLDWLGCYWSHFGNGQRLRVLMVYAGDEPIGILPLSVVNEETRVGRIRVLTYPLHDWGGEYGPIGPNPTATLVAGLRHIQHGHRDWDLLDLRWVRKRGLDFGRTQTALQTVGLAHRERIWKTTAVIDLSAGWQTYLDSRSSKFRNNMRRNEKRLKSIGNCSFERFRPSGSRYGDDDPRWDLFEECVSLARRSWQGSSKTGTTLSHQSVHAFFQDCHALAAAAGAVDITMLRVNDEPAAFSYNYHHEGRLFGLRTGFSRAFAKQGAGSVLWSNMFQDSCERGDRHFDLGPESPEVKKNWVTDWQPIHHYTHYPALAPVAQLLRLKHWWSEHRRGVPPRSPA